MQTKIEILLLIALAMVFSGCAGVKNTMRPSEKISRWNPLAKIKDDHPEQKAGAEAKPPETMAVIWKDTTFEKPGSSTVKGFGGRIYFYDADNTAVKADGELIVYGFDDSDESNASKTAQADRKFVFPSEHLQSHYSETDLGPSYSVWVPWEKVGGIRKTITLIPVFKSANGSVLKSGQSINVLPGKSPNSDSNAIVVSTPKSKPIPGLQQIGFESEISMGQSAVRQASLLAESDQVDAYKQPRIRTSTISLTPALATQMAAAGPTPLLPIATPSSVAPQAPNVAQQAGLNPDSAIEAKTETETSLDSSGSVKKKSKNSPSVFGTPGSFR